VKAIRQNFRQGGQIPSLSCTDSEVGCFSSNGILASSGWFVGGQEREAGVHNHKNILVKRQSKMFKANKISKIYKCQFENNLFLSWLSKFCKKSFVIDV
jgi:hypothetical protein